MKRFHIYTLSRRHYRSTVLWAVALSLFIVVSASLLGRAAHNFRAALTDKPDLAVYLLLPEEHITTMELLRETPEQRDYLAETVHGPSLITLKKGAKEWYISLVEPLHERP